MKTEPEGQEHTCAHWTCLLNASASLFVAFSSSTSQVFTASGSIILQPAAISSMSLSEAAEDVSEVGDERCEIGLIGAHGPTLKKPAI